MPTSASARDAGATGASRLVVEPGPPLAGAFDPPGDKSITHRAYLLALLARGTSFVENANGGADCRGTLECARRLGLREVGEETGGVRRLEGRGFELTEPDRVLDCGNSGTTLRLLAGILAGQEFLAVLAGDASLQRRPVARVIEPLRRMGAALHARDHDRYPPLVVRGAPLRAIEIELPIPSAQVATCVLLAGLQASGVTTVGLPGPARDHTERMLASLGAPLEVEPTAAGGRRVALRGPWTPPPQTHRIPGDPSAAAFFLAAAAARPGARVTARGVTLNPTRTGFLDVLEGMGARVERRAVGSSGGEEAGDVTVTGPERLEAMEIPKEWLPRLLDEVPAWAVVAAAAQGRSRLGGAAELRVKESDRIAVIVRNLRAVGIEAQERPDGLEIEGGPVRGGTVRAADDHRIAMAFALLGVGAREPVVVEEAGGIGTSFPEFVATLRGLGGRVGK